MPLANSTTPANGNEREEVLPLLDKVKLRTLKRGRPRKRLKVLATVLQHTLQVCNEDGYYTVVPAPAYIYNPYVYGSPYPGFEINFGFGRGFHR